MLVFTADLHGEWKALYEKLPKGAEVICVCGDAQPVLFEKDLELIPAPRQYLQKGEFLTQADLPLTL